jgi:hypothetical protein
MQKMRVNLPVKLAFGAVLLTVAGCGTTIQSALDCSKLVGPSLRTDVPVTPPPEDNTIGSWVSVADARHGDTDKANNRANTVIEICDAVGVENERLTRRSWWPF